MCRVCPRIAHCQTEVDETGQSYYGGSRLAFMLLAFLVEGRVGRVTPSPLSPSRCVLSVLRSQGGEVKKDITDEECQGGCVQARPECSSRALHLNA
jgi:hypothetical protein